MVKAGLSQTQGEIIIEQVQLVQKDESTHVDFLSTSIETLGGTPFNGCTFNFDGVLTDVSSVIALHLDHTADLKL